MRILILDDDPDRHEWFEKAFSGKDITKAYTYEEAVSALDSGKKYDVVFLDHDLGSVENGVDVATHIAKSIPEHSIPELVWIHSMNPVGARRMEDVLKDRGIRFCRTPFGSF